MRIIAGRLGGRTLQAPRGMATRPTTDRVREALFSILGDLTGFTVVDCYSGSGAIGLEALSRGASHVLLVESGRAAQVMIRTNVERLGVGSEITLVRAAVEDSRVQLARMAPLHLVIADPPWPIADRSAQVVARVVRGLLAPGAVVALGHRRSEPVELGDRSGLRLTQRRHWGDSAISFFEQDPSS